MLSLDGASRAGLGAPRICLYRIYCGRSSVSVSTIVPLEAFAACWRVIVHREKDGVNFWLIAGSKV